MCLHAGLRAGEHAEKHHADQVQRVATFNAMETLENIERHLGYMLAEYLPPGWFQGCPGEETKADAAAISALIVAADRVGRFDRPKLLKASRLADCLAVRVRNHRTVLLDSHMAVDTSELGAIAALRRSGERLRELMQLPAGAPELVIPPPAPAEVLTKQNPESESVGRGNPTPT